MELSTEAQFLCDSMNQFQQRGLPPPPASIQALKDVGNAAAPWLLSQRQWQCTQCERPATTLGQSMAVWRGVDDTDAVCAINSVPSLPVCDNDSCDRKNIDAGRQMVRELRSSLTQRPPAQWSWVQ